MFDESQTAHAHYTKRVSALSIKLTLMVEIANPSRSSHFPTNAWHAGCVPKLYVCMTSLVRSARALQIPGTCVFRVYVRCESEGKVRNRFAFHLWVVDSLPVFHQVLHGALLLSAKTRCWFHPSDTTSEAQVDFGVHVERCRVR